MLYAAAALLAIVYIVFSVMVYNRVDDAGITEPLWARSVLVLQGIEAMAFTAVGWLFGREVYRGEAKTAKAQAEDAKVESTSARAAQWDAVERAAAAESSGLALAEAVRARAAASAATVPRAEDAEGGNESQPADRGSGGRLPDAGVDHLKDLADRLFPPQG